MLKMTILDKVDATISDSKSIITFSTTGGGSWPVWDRYLEIDGKPAYHIGNICGTCAFFFEKLDGAVKIDDPAYSIERLNNGISSIDNDIIAATGSVLPNGAYAVILHDILPVLIHPNDPSDYFSHEQMEAWGANDSEGAPHHPKTIYYRLRTGLTGPHEGFFEFLVPMFPQTWLDEERVAHYQASLSANARPTILTLSVLDEKVAEEADQQSIWDHTCLAHYIVDGHHKAYAAAKSGRPITALSFVALNQGVSAPSVAKTAAIDICARALVSTHVSGTAP